MPTIASYLLMLVSMCTLYIMVQQNNNHHLMHAYLYIGDAGRHSDGGVLANSAFGQALVEGYINLPNHRPLPDGIF